MHRVKFRNNSKYGGTTSKRGGGRLDAVGTKGDKGIPTGGKKTHPKPLTSGPIICSPGKLGNKGIPSGGYKHSKAPRD